MMELRFWINQIKKTKNLHLLNLKKYEHGFWSSQIMNMGFEGEQKQWNAGRRENP